MASLGFAGDWLSFLFFCIAGKFGFELCEGKIPLRTKKTGNNRGVKKEEEKVLVETSPLWPRPEE